MIRNRRTIAAVAVATAVLWPFGSATAFSGAQSGYAQPTDEDSPCELVQGDKRALCLAMAARDCNYASRTDYWLCRAYVERNCNLAEQSDYWICRGLTERNCNLVERSDYWKCRGLTENCNYSDETDRAECRAFRRFFRG